MFSGSMVTNSALPWNLCKQNSLKYAKLQFSWALKQWHTFQSLFWISNGNMEEYQTQEGSYGALHSIHYILILTGSWWMTRILWMCPNSSVTALRVSLGVDWSEEENKKVQKHFPEAFSHIILVPFNNHINTLHFTSALSEWLLILHVSR